MRFKESFLNGIEIFNEVGCLLNSYGFLIFTDLTNDANLEYKIGLFLFYANTFIIIVNGLCVGYLVLKYIWKLI